MRLKYHSATYLDLNNLLYLIRQDQYIINPPTLIICNQLKHCFKDEKYQQLKFIKNYLYLSNLPRMHNIQILFLLSICLITTSLNAQHLRLEDIPEVSLDDFKAKPKSDAPFPAYMSLRTLYRLDSIVEISKDKFKLKVITTVQPVRDNCFFDQTKIAKNVINSVLKHEKGLELQQ